MRALGLLPLLAACGGGGEGQQAWRAADFVPVQGMHLEYTPPEDTAAAPLMLRAEDGWTLRIGESWGEAAEAGAFEVRTEDGLWVGGEQLLPSKVAEGAKGAGVEITAIAEHTTYYGTFDTAVTVEVASGRWAGTQVLAYGFGPVTLTLDGEVWDLVYYE